jgi:hypothetical protein
MARSEGDIKNNQANVDIEAIMREIRLEILETQDVFQRIPGLSRAFKSGHLQPDLYDHLYQAGLSAHVGDITLYVTPSRLPIVGFLWQFMRRKWHEMALLYVGILAGQQSVINEQLLTAVVELVNELDYRPEK